MEQTVSHHTQQEMFKATPFSMLSGHAPPHSIGKTTGEAAALDNDNAIEPALAVVDPIDGLASCAC